MTRHIFFSCASLILALPLSAQTNVAFSAPAGETSPYTSPYVDPVATTSYCEYVMGVAASEAAPLSGPTLFGTFGNSTAELLPTNLSSSTVVASRNRLFAGGSFSLGNVQRASALKRVARADCEQYKITAGLEAFLQDNTEGFTSNALEARAQVLREALPHSTEILSRTGKSMEAHVATDQEYHGMQLRRDELLQILEQTESDLGKAAKSESLAPLSLPELLKKESDLLSRKEEEEGKARETGAWDLSVRVGYERILAAPQIQPVFGTATLSFNLGRLWQASAEKRASAGFRHWIQQDPVGPSVRTFMLLQHYRAIQKAEADRLRETDTLLADLEQRLGSVQQLTDRRVESYADYVWFDYIKIKAEHAYLVAHLKDLSMVAGEPFQ
jgi:hypothetical protein